MDVDVDEEGNLIMFNVEDGDKKQETHTHTHTPNAKDTKDIRNNNKNNKQTFAKEV